MFIVGLNGSPNKDGNTKHLLNIVVNEAGALGADTAVLDICEYLGSAKHSFCTACSNPCSSACYKGTKLEEAFNIIGKADGIVFGSPVYFGTISAQLKAFFDKTRKLRVEKALYNKIAAGVTVAASRFGGQETAIKAMHDIMLVHGMIIVADGYADDDCGHHGVCAQRPSNADEFAQKRAKILARRMVEVCGTTSGLRNKI